jgi:multicomponent Na+:H+ antiporter subunit C
VSVLRPARLRAGSPPSARHRACQLVGIEVAVAFVGYVTGGIAPYFSDISPHTKPVVDPVVQALALTDVVVEAAVTALLLAFAIQAYKRFGTLDPHELAELKG